MFQWRRKRGQTSYTLHIIKGETRNFMGVNNRKVNIFVAGHKKCTVGSYGYSKVITLKEFLYCDCEGKTSIQYTSVIILDYYN
jgi:hypothetical protein